jgi:hypothetical protein
LSRHIFQNSKILPEFFKFLPYSREIPCCHEGDYQLWNPTNFSLFLYVSFSCRNSLLQQEATTSSDTSGSFIASNKESSLVKRNNNGNDFSPHYMTEEREIKL